MVGSSEQTQEVSSTQSLQQVLPLLSFLKCIDGWAGEGGCYQLEGHYQPKSLMVIIGCQDASVQVRLS